MREGSFRDAEWHKLTGRMVFLRATKNPSNNTIYWAAGKELELSDHGVIYSGKRGGSFLE